MGFTEVGEMKMIKSGIVSLAKWAKNHASELVTLIGLLICVFILFVLFSWGVGYYMNGLAGYKFDLGSIWQGLGACVTAIGSLMTMAGVNLGKQYIDSRFNSPPGEKPRREAEDIDKRRFS